MCPVRIGNPISSFFQLPIDPTNPWAISFPGVEHPYSINLDCTPSKKLINSEYGGRFSGYLPGIDFSVSAMRTWTKMPCFAGSVSQDGSLVFNGVYDRMTMLGADASLPLGKLVVRSEFAEYLGEVQTPTQIETNPQKKNTLNFLIGIDWYPGNDWTIAAQYSHKYIAGFSTGIAGYRNSGLATLRIAKDLF